MPRPSPVDTAYALELGRRLRAQRNLKGLAQADLAVAVGCSQQLIARIEAGRTLPSAERLDRMLVALSQDGEPAAGSLPAGQQAADLNTRFFAMPGAVELAGAFGGLPTSQRRALVNLALAMAAAASNPHRRS